MYVLPMTLAPHAATWPFPSPKSRAKRHCHGQECRLASVPPTMRANETSGWVTGVPHCAGLGAGIIIIIKKFIRSPLEGPSGAV